MKGIARKTSRRHVVSSAARVVDLCCGMGGLSVAARDLGMTIAGGVDLNPHALRTFAKNFPDAEVILKSVRSPMVVERCRMLLNGDANQPRVVLSGPPCQGFSLAGSRDPKDSRNQVLVAVARAIASIQPDCALIENVSTVLSMQYGDRLKKFRMILAEGNYHVLKILLNSSEFGVPQKRKRAFFIVTRQVQDHDRILGMLEQYKAPAITVRDALHGLPTPAVRPDAYDDEAALSGPSNHLAMQHSERVKKKIAAIPPGTGPMSYRRLHPARQANTLFSGHRAPPAHYAEPRSITVREAARLQGFPDNFRIYGSFGNQMEQVTNAVPPPLTRAVLRVLLKLSAREMH
ncbi:MAG TPA: DNA cytosine methyltransferase [Kiritimatiellia bacterium]|nr:DNA cytosine methyltransferase [Kiritimatiellia bacterium]